MSGKKIVILGSTGSIGVNAVKVAEHLCSKIEVVGLVARKNVSLLAEQAAKLNCPYAITSDTSRLSDLKSLLPSSCEALAGEEAVIELVTRDDVDCVLCAIVGMAGLLPVLEAVKAGKDIALASKEVLVAAGELVMEEAGRSGSKMLPVDSEHSAVFQCLEGRRHQEIAKIILTASGGPFRKLDISELENVSYESALRHPTWDMGPKVTVDSATMMNKALEIIEARWLFDVPGENIDVVIHPQSVIHSMVEFVDATILAQMSTPDMRFPIQYALSYPHKVPGTLKPLDFSVFNSLSFELPDNQKFPSLNLAHESLRLGGTVPTVLNAANEVAVDAFRNSAIKFTGIWRLIEKVMQDHESVSHPSLEDILHADAWARSTASDYIPNIVSKS